MLDLASLDVEIERRDVDVAGGDGHSLLDVVAVRLILEFAFRNDEDLFVPPVHSNYLLAADVQITDLVNIRISMGEGGEVAFNPRANLTTSFRLLGMRKPEIVKRRRARQVAYLAR